NEVRLGVAEGLYREIADEGSTLGSEPYQLLTATFKNNANQTLKTDFPKWTSFLISVDASLNSKPHVQTSNASVLATGQWESAARSVENFLGSTLEWLQDQSRSVKNRMDEPALPTNFVWAMALPKDSVSDFHRNMVAKEVRLSSKARDFLRFARD